MPRRYILTERQRSELLGLPVDETSLLRHYTLADDDLEYINQRRRPENRLGFALQLCALRHPGRALSPGEVIPIEVLAFIDAQLGITGDALLDYAARRQTRQEHMVAIRHQLRLKVLRLQSLCQPPFSKSTAPPVGQWSRYSWGDFKSDPRA